MTGSQKNIVFSEINVNKTKKDKWQIYMNFPEAKLHQFHFLYSVKWNQCFITIIINISISFSYKYNTSNSDIYWEKLISDSD